MNPGKINQITVTCEAVCELGASAAVLLAYLCEVHDQAEQKGELLERGFFPCTRQDLTNAIGMLRRQQENAIAELSDKKYVKVKANQPGFNGGIRLFRINKEILESKGYYGITQQPEASIREEVIEETPKPIEIIETAEPIQEIPAEPIEVISVVDEIPIIEKKACEPADEPITETEIIEEQSETIIEETPEQIIEDAQEPIVEKTEPDDATPSLEELFQAEAKKESKSRKKKKQQTEDSMDLFSMFATSEHSVSPYTPQETLTKEEAKVVVAESEDEALIEATSDAKLTDYSEPEDEILILEPKSMPTPVTASEPFSETVSEPPTEIYSEPEPPLTESTAAERTDDHSVHASDPKSAFFSENNWITNTSNIIYHPQSQMQQQLAQKVGAILGKDVDIYSKCSDLMTILGIRAQLEYFDMHNLSKCGSSKIQQTIDALLNFAKIAPTLSPIQLKFHQAILVEIIKFIIKGHNRSILSFEYRTESPQPRQELQKILVEHYNDYQFNINIV